MKTRKKLASANFKKQNDFKSVLTVGLPAPDHTEHQSKYSNIPLIFQVRALSSFKKTYVDQYNGLTDMPCIVPGVQRLYPTDAID